MVNLVGLVKLDGWLVGCFGCFGCFGWLVGCFGCYVKLVLYIAKSSLNAKQSYVTQH